MSTTIDPAPAQPKRMKSIERSAPAAPMRRTSRWRRWIVLLLVLGGVGAGVTWGAASGLQHYFGSTETLQVLTEKATRGHLIVTVTEDGNVESASNIDIKCHVAGGSTILWIVPDGTIVEKGDILVKLDSSTIEDLINSQRIVFERAVAARIQAEKEYSSAKTAVQEYAEGTYLKEVQAADALITIAMENLRSAENSLEHTSRLARKGYVTPLQLDAQKFAVQRAQLDLDTAQITKNVLEKFTRMKITGDLESARDAAEARMRSEQAACELEQTRLKRLMTQMEQCTITAPQDGMVVYANDMGSSRGGSTSGVKIEEGAVVRDQQTIVRVPDLAQMQVKTLVHESKVDTLAPGMRARVLIQDRQFQGEVKSIGNQPEPTSFFSSSVKEYATYVRIDGAPEGLKPGMTAEVEILVADLKNVLSVPVQAVVELHGKFYVWVKRDQQLEQRPVLVGLTNNTRIEIKDGVADDELVVLNPRTIVPAALDDVVEEERVDISARFGNNKPRAQTAGVEAPGKAPAKGDSAASTKATARSDFKLSDFDSDKDGKISQSEAPARMAQNFDLLDANHDGAIDAREFAALKAKMQSMQGGARAPPGPVAYRILRLSMEEDERRVG